MGKPGVMLYFEVRPTLKHLSNEEKGQLLDAILAYGQEGVEPTFYGILAVVWEFIKVRIDHDTEVYNQIVEKRREAGRKGGEARQRLEAIT